MLYYAFVFFVLALAFGLFGFGLVASTFASIAKVLFWLFVVVFVISLVMGAFNKRRPPRL